MVIWEELADDFVASSWDSLLSGASDAHPFQLFAWGEYKRLSGWRPSRYIARNKNGFQIGMVQVLAKRYLSRIGIIWIPGGVVMNFSQSVASGMRPKLLACLIEKLKCDFGTCYIRFNFGLPNSPSFSFDLGQFCSRPVIKLSGGYSVMLDLDKDETELVENFSSKHRYYVKKALTNDISWRNGNNPDLALHMATLLREIVLKKGVNSIFVSHEEITKLCELASKNVLILVGYHDNEPITACLVIMLGERAFYLIAATGEEGRKLNAAYGMVMRLMQILKGQGIKYFDLGGLNPQDQGASGVSHFKRGFGGSLIEYLGEWECATSWPLVPLANAGIYIRGNRL